MALNYYRLNLSAISYGELRRLAKNWIEFGLAALFKTFRITLRQPFAQARPTHLMRIAPEAVSPVVQSMLKNPLDEARELGMEEGIWYSAPLIGSAENVVVARRMPDGEGVFDCTAFLAVQNGITIEKKVTTSFVTDLRNDRILQTAAGHNDIDFPPSFDREILRTRSLAKVLERHRDRLAMAGATAIRINSEDELEQIRLKAEQAIFDFNIEREVFVPLTESEVAQVKSQSASDGSAPSDAAVSPSGYWMNWTCWFSIGFGVFLLSDGPGNEAQNIFRGALVGGGVLGLIILAVIRKRKANGQSKS